MLLRRRAIMNGATDWKDITETATRPTAWVENAGLRASFTYAGMKVIRKAFSGDTYTELHDELEDLITKKPTGIVVYSESRGHAVFVCDYDPATDTFYCMDPASTADSGRIELAESTLGIKQRTIVTGLTCYWYVSSNAYTIGEYTVSNNGNGVNLRSGTTSSYTKLAVVPDGTVLSITAVTGKLGLTEYGGRTGWVNLTVCERTLSAYQLIYFKNGGSGTQMDNTVCFYGRENYVADCSYTKSGSYFSGWTVYRPTDHKWLYTNGTSNSWSLPGSESEGYAKKVMQPGDILKKATGFNGGQLFLYAKWTAGTAPAPTPTPVVSEPPEAEPEPAIEPEPEPDPVIDPEPTPAPTPSPEPTPSDEAKPGTLSPGLDNFKRLMPYVDGLFQDVDEDSWYGSHSQGVIKAAFELGLMDGVGSGCFAPGGNMTVAQAITMACRLHSIYHTGEESFVQSPDDWFAVYFDYAVENSIVSPNLAFPYEEAKTTPATRAEFARYLSASMPEEALYCVHDIAMGEIPDVDGETIYCDDIYLLYRAGVLSGSDEAGSFHPYSGIRRAEAAAIVARMAKPLLRV